MGIEEQRQVKAADNGGWVVKAPKASRASSYHERRSQAVERAVAIVEQVGGGTVIIHDQSGEIVEERPVEAAASPSQ
jgi:Uncharacterized protein conserved in bacteria (DUF2188)